MSMFVYSVFTSKHNVFVKHEMNIPFVLPLM